MPGGVFSTAKLFGMTVRESANDGSDFTNPDADYRVLFVGEDGLFHLKDSAGAVTTPTQGGYTPGGTDVAVADGGTGAGTAAGARTNLGLVLGTDVQAFDADIPTVAASQAEMEAGAEAALRSMSPLRVAQAIAALAAGGGGGPIVHVRQVSRQGSITTTSTTFVVIDNTKLPAVSVAGCAVGDLIQLELTGGLDNSGSAYHWFDWEVVQPTAGTRRTSTQPNDSGSALAFVSATTREGFTARGFWVCGEAGTHTFQPMWRVNAGTGSIENAVSGNDDILIQHTVKRWPVANVF